MKPRLMASTVQLTKILEKTGYYGHLEWEMKEGTNTGKCSWREKSHWTHHMFRMNNFGEVMWVGCKSDLTERVTHIPAWLMIAKNIPDDAHCPSVLWRVEHFYRHDWQWQFWKLVSTITWKAVSYTEWEQFKTVLDAFWKETKATSSSLLLFPGVACGL